MKYKYFKKWKERDAEWFEVTKEEAAEVLSGAYREVDLIFETLHEGHQVNTVFSLFKAEEVS